MGDFDGDGYQTRSEEDLSFCCGGKRRHYHFFSQKAKNYQNKISKH